MEAEIERLAAGLAGLGLSPGSKIAFYMETRKEWFTMAHAAWRAGLTVVTVYASLGDEAVIDALTESEATVLFSSAPLLEKTGARVRKAFQKFHFVTAIWVSESNSDLKYTKFIAE